MSCSSVEGSGWLRSPGRSMRNSACWPSRVSRISSVPRSRSASTISSRKNGLPATSETEIGQHFRDAPLHGEARLHETHLLVGAQPFQLDGHDLRDDRRHAVVGAGDEDGQDREGDRGASRASVKSSSPARSPHCKPSSTTTTGCRLASVARRYRTPVKISLRR